MTKTKAVSPPPPAAPPAPRKLSFTAREAAEPVIAFGVARSLGYRARMRTVFGLLVLGFGLQVGLLNVWLGLPFLIGALILSWVQGYDNKLDRRRARMDGAWEHAEVSRLKEILALDHKMRRWDESLLDVSSFGGAMMFLLAGGVIGVGCYALSGTWPQVAWILGVDGSLLILSQWFNGMRSIQTRGDLVLKTKHVLEVLDHLDEEAAAPGELKLRMHMSGPKEQRAPDDFKLVADYPDGPEGFHGVQAQVVINRVQGTPYPYFYAVLVAKHGLHLLKRAKPKDVPADVVVETETKDDVDVIIIRQHTTRTSGYHTQAGRSRQILVTALAAAGRFSSSGRRRTSS